MGPPGFEPESQAPKAQRIDQATLRTQEYNSSLRRELNPRPLDYKSSAPPTELLRHQVLNKNSLPNTIEVIYYLIPSSYINLLVNFNKRKNKPQKTKKQIKKE